MTTLFGGGLFGGRDRRKRVRRLMLEKNIRASVVLPNGDALRGVLADISQRGVGIAGDPVGLAVDQEVELILTYPSGTNVKCRCRIRHMDRAVGHWGAEVVSSPAWVEVQPEESTKT